jgi:hypothetical protein
LSAEVRHDAPGGERGENGRIFQGFTESEKAERGALGMDGIPEGIRAKYEVQEWRHAGAVLRGDFPEQ